MSNGTVDTTQPYGWQQAGLQSVTSGTQVSAYERFKLLYALGSVDQATGLPREYVGMLAPEYVASGVQNPNPGPGLATLTNTEPTFELSQGLVYMWGRWPVFKTGRADGRVEQFQGGGSSKTRSIIWIDKSVSPAIHRFFFFPNGTGQRMHVSITTPCTPTGTEMDLDTQSYVEVIQNGNCCEFAGNPVQAGSNGWWNDAAINAFVEAVFALKDNAELGP